MIPLISIAISRFLQLDGPLRSKTFIWTISLSNWKHMGHGWLPLCCEKTTHPPRTNHESSAISSKWIRHTFDWTSVSQDSMQLPYFLGRLFSFQGWCEVLVSGSGFLAWCSLPWMEGFLWRGCYSIHRSLGRWGPQYFTPKPYLGILKILVVNTRISIK